MSVALLQKSVAILQLTCEADVDPDMDVSWVAEGDDDSGARTGCSTDADWILKLRLVTASSHTEHPFTQLSVINEICR